MTHYNRGKNVTPLYMIVQGTVGTGKSYLIGTINKYLNQLALPHHCPLFLLASIGVAAYNIGGSTIHSKLKIPVNDFSQLEVTRLTNFQEEVSHVRYILIDEKSFIGEKLLENIDSWLCQAFPQNVDVNFVG